MKTAFLILGAQRSGTSVTSHLLSLFGVDFGNPQNFIQFAHNPIFFELDWVNKYNNKLIDSLGYKYTDFFLPIEDDFVRVNTTETKQELQLAIKDEWQQANTIGIKDPRIALTFPVWEKVLLANNYQCKIMLAFRNPSGFLKSNKKLLHNWPGWNDQRHLNFWLQMNLAAIYFTQNFSVYYLNYDSLMKNPLTEVEKLASFFNLDFDGAPDAANIINSFYYHYKEGTETGNAFVDNCYQKMCSQALLPSDYLNYRNIALL